MAGVTITDGGMGTTIRQVARSLEAHCVGRPPMTAVATATGNGAPRRAWVIIMAGGITIIMDITTIRAGTITTAHDNYDLGAKSG